MSAETDTYAILAGGMGSPQPVQDRIFPDSLPDDATLPAIVYRRVGTVPVLTLNSSTDAAQVTIETECWANTRAAANALANAINAAMIAASHMPIERQNFQDEETGEFAVTQSFSVWEV